MEVRHCIWLLLMVIQDAFGSFLPIMSLVLLIFITLLTKDQESKSLSQNLMKGTLQEVLMRTFCTYCGLDLMNMEILFIFRSLYETINKPADGGVTALHMAALNGHVDSVQLLIDLGASVNQVTVEAGATIDLIGNLFSDSIFLLH